MNKAGAVLVLLPFLSACSLFGPKIPDVEVREEVVPIVCDTSAKPDALDLKDTPPTLVFDTETETWGFWFDSELYAALAENLQAMRRWMSQSRDIRDKLVACIDDHNARARSSPS